MTNQSWVTSCGLAEKVFTTPAFAYFNKAANSMPDQVECQTVPFHKWIQEKNTPLPVELGPRAILPGIHILAASCGTFYLKYRVI